MFKKTKIEDAPRAQRPRESKFERTKDWQLLKQGIDAGLKPGEALSVIFTDEDKQRMGIESRRTLARFVQKYLAERELPYTLRSFTRKGEGDYIIVEYPRHGKKVG
jgi:hypothetical protein